jgi:hypothetical protein
MAKIVITALVIVNLAASLWHGSTHTHLAIEFSTEQILFLYIIVIIAPVVAAVLVWTRYVSMGLWMFFLSMLGSFLFGAYQHYVLVSPDNIHHLPAGTPEFHSHFMTSAGVIALLELASALYGAFWLGRYHAQARARVTGA